MAQCDMFLDIDGIPGESQDDKFKDKIEVQSYSFGATNSGSAASYTGQGQGIVSVGDLHVSKTVDKASPKLFEACATGQHIDKATLSIRKAGGDKQLVYLKYELTSVLVSSYNVGASSGPIVTEQISLNFGKMKKTYTPQTSKGGGSGDIVGGWDVQKNVKT